MITNQLILKSSMKIYIAHSREFDYEKELYWSIRASKKLPQADIILPHEPGYDNQQDRDFYRHLDLIIAEVSYPATGLGIELGWAADDHTPIACIYRAGRKYSGSLHAVTDHFYEYNSNEELQAAIEHIIAKNQP